MLLLDDIDREKNFLKEQNKGRSKNTRQAIKYNDRE